MTSSLSAAVWQDCSGLGELPKAEPAWLSSIIRCSMSKVRWAGSLPSLALNSRFSQQGQASRRSWAVKKSSSLCIATP